ncbi:hypothetical protein Glove_13g182 [Diversispora epigaea]|uniref:BTB domain-containing protein n=1 Tax=Diversispora epigaea TaxID=1348612 RepID=A0A397JQJ8_9GLOM|nr:hypothetical protein Glove_13g182 [Diversispora epigaea]
MDNLRGGKIVELSQNFIELLNDKDDCDVIIEVGNNDKSFTAHSNILKYRSTYFRKELENIQSNENNIKTIIKSSVSAQIFDVLLIYIYGGIVNLKNVETGFIFDLLLAANKFELDELTNKLETHLIDTKTFWLKSNFFLVWRSVLNENNFNNLENFCNDIITNHPSLIFESSDFTSLPESTLMSLLKRDDLQMEEVKIWDHVIKWGIVQNPTLPANLGEWSKENIITLKTTLQEYLPYIHINHSPKRQLKSIISPSRFTIISEEHAAEISTWIDRKTINYSTKNIPYKFKLILRGTRDGFASQTFWKNCHGLAKTVVVAKVEETDEILGGYNPLAWDNSYNNIGGDWKETKDSFIFSLKNGDIQNSILSRIKNLRYAIHNVSKYNQTSIGPSFGDFCLYSEKPGFTFGYCDRKGTFFEEPISPSSSFSIVNYEVFKIVRKSLI